MTTPHEKALKAAHVIHRNAIYCNKPMTDLIVSTYLTALSEQGYVVVPVEPTEEMAREASKEWNRLRVATPSIIYKAMLAAIPRETD